MLSNTSSSLWPALHEGQQGNESCFLPLVILGQGEGGVQSTALWLGHSSHWWLCSSSVPPRVSGRTCCHQASTGCATSGIRQQDCHALKCCLLSGLFLGQYQNMLPMAHSKEPQKASEFFASLGKWGLPRPSVSKVPSTKTRKIGSFTPQAQPC